MVALLVWDHIQSVRCNDCTAEHRVAILVWDQIYWLADSTIQIHGWWANTNSEAVVWNVVCRIPIHICVNWCNFTYCTLYLYSFGFLFVCVSIDGSIAGELSRQSVLVTQQPPTSQFVRNSPNLPICPSPPTPKSFQYCNTLRGNIWICIWMRICINCRRTCHLCFMIFCSFW